MSEPTTQTIALGDRVGFSGTVEKFRDYEHGGIGYRDQVLPGFVGYEWAPGKNGVTQNLIGNGIIVGKRKYAQMEVDDGIWIPCGDYFTGYLVAYHLARKPIIVRLDQMTEINGEAVKHD